MNICRRYFICNRQPKHIDFPKDKRADRQIWLNYTLQKKIDTQPNRTHQTNNILRSRIPETQSKPKCLLAKKKKDKKQKKTNKKETRNLIVIINIEMKQKNKLKLIEV